MQTHHCLLIGDTATRLAREFSIEEENFEYFLTDYAVKEFENMKNYKASLMDLFNSKTRYDLRFFKMSNYFFRVFK